MMVRALGVAAMVAVLTFSVNASAFAAGNGDRVGKNIGDLLGGWAKSLYAGIAAIACLVFLLNRRFAELALFLCAAVLVGGFVFAPGQIAATMKDIWLSITA